VNESVVIAILSGLVESSELEFCKETYMMDGSGHWLWEKRIEGLDAGREANREVGEQHCGAVTARKRENAKQTTKSLLANIAES
jgi:hypothetical protein